MKRHLQGAEQAQSASNLTKYCACHEICKFKISAETPWIASANRKTIRRHSEHNPITKSHLAPAASETLLVRPWTRFCIEKYIISRSGYLPKCHQMLRLPRKVTLQLHQILRLPRKMHLMIDPRHIWHIIYNARSNHSHPPMSPNTAPATQNESHDWSASHMKRHLQCAEQAQSASNLTKYRACHEICKFKISAETPWIASANRKTIRRHSEHNPITKSHLAPAASETLLVRPWTRFCIKKYNISRSGYLPKCHQMLRLPRKVTLQLHQILRLARKMHSTLLYSILFRHPFSLGIYSL